MVRFAWCALGLAACTMSFDDFEGGPRTAVLGSEPPPGATAGANPGAGVAGPQNGGGAAADASGTVGSDAGLGADAEADGAGAPDSSGDTGSPPLPPPPPPTCDEPNLVARYGFDGNTLDCTSHHLDGAIVGNETYFGGHAGQCLYLDGSSWVSLGNSAAVQLGGAFTVGAWIKSQILPTQTGSAQHLIGKVQNILNAGWRLSVEPQSTLSFLVSRGNGQALTASGSGATVASFVHVAGVFVPGTSARLYLNGSMVGQSTGPAPNAVTDAPVELRIGARGDGVGGTYFSGCVDDLRIYDRALTTAEVAGIASP